MNGFRVLCAILLLASMLPAVAMAQSAGTTPNATGTSNQTSAPPATTGSKADTNNAATSVTESPEQSPSIDETSDNSPENATPIEIGQIVTGSLPVGDQDWTTFRADSEGQITVSFTAENQTNMSAFIYSDRELLQSSYVPPGGETSLTASVNYGGQYYVFIRNEAPDTPGSYSFEVSKSNSSESETPLPGANEPEADSGSSELGIFPILGILAAVSVIIVAGYTLMRRRGEGNELEEEE